jgi:hypothetical protein
VVRTAGAAGADVARRALRGVRRALVAGGGEQLREQHEQDHPAGGLRVRAGTAARAQGCRQEGGEFAPHRPLAYETMRLSSWTFPELVGG